MTYAGVAVDTGKHVARRLCGQHVIDEILVAVEAGLLHHPAVAWLDLNRILVVARCESERMEEAVVGLREVLSNEVVRCVTVVTDRHGVMARLLPRVVIRLHDMAVGTRCGIIAEVSVAFAVAKGKESQAAENTTHDSNRQRQHLSASHAALACCRFAHLSPP